MPSIEALRRRYHAIVGLYQWCAQAYAMCTNTRQPLGSFLRQTGLACQRLETAGMEQDVL